MPYILNLSGSYDQTRPHSTLAGVDFPIQALDLFYLFAQRRGFRRGACHSPQAFAEGQGRAGESNGAAMHGTFLLL